LRGDAGADRLLGGGGSDRINGGAGGDRLAGGVGADVFAFRSGGGRDLVTDFSDGPDRLDLTALGLAGFGKVLDAARDSGAATILSFPEHEVAIRLAGFALGDLTRDDVLI
jgi:Ca2+-binding RTX toxin-like protein